MLLSIETEARIARVLLTLAEGERVVEVSRQVLSDNYDFDGYKVFHRLDVEGKNRIDATNIVEFLKSKGVYCTQTEAMFLILFYDEDGDGCLSLSEFLNLVQSPISMERHKQITTAHNSKLSFHVEYSLMKLLEKEIELGRGLLTMLSELQMRSDFNLHDVFHSMKSWNCVTVESLKMFLERNSASCINADLQAMMKRMDLNKDGRVDIRELHALFGFPKCKRGCPCDNLKCQCVCCKDCCSGRNVLGKYIDGIERNCIENKETEMEMNVNKDNSQPNKEEHCRKDELQPVTHNNVNANNLKQQQQNVVADTMAITKPISKNLSLRLSPERKYSPVMMNNSTSSMMNPYELNPTDNNNQNHEHTLQPHIPPSYQPNTPFNTIQPLLSTHYFDTQKQKFIEYLQQLMQAESKIERMKIDISIRNDFNIEDAFRIFELNGRGFITEDDLKYGLNALDIYPTAPETHLLLKRFDLQKEGILNYADFFDMVTPFDKSYRGIVEHRTPNSCCSCRCIDMFLLTTRLLLKQLFMLLIDYESKFNYLKKEFTGVRCKLREIYGEIDVCGLGKVGEKEIVDFLKRVGIFTSIKDADLLFIRLDKNRDGMVDYWELEEEFVPSY